MRIAGDADDNPITPNAGPNYMGSPFKPNMLDPNPAGPNTFIKDPFGNAYGYSTVKASAPGETDGYNPTFDLWSTGGTITNPVDQSQWMKNW